MELHAYLDALVQKIDLLAFFQIMQGSVSAEFSKSWHAVQVVF